MNPSRRGGVWCVIIFIIPVVSFRELTNIIFSKDNWFLLLIEFFMRRLVPFFNHDVHGLGGSHGGFGEEVGPFIIQWGVLVFMIRLKKLIIKDPPHPISKNNLTLHEPLLLIEIEIRTGQFIPPTPTHTHLPPLLNLEPNPIRLDPILIFIRIIRRGTRITLILRPQWLVIRSTETTHFRALRL